MARPSVNCPRVLGDFSLCYIIIVCLSFCNICRKSSAILTHMCHNPKWRCSCRWRQRRWMPCDCVSDCGNFFFFLHLHSINFYFSPSASFGRSFIFFFVFVFVNAVCALISFVYGCVFNCPEPQAKASVDSPALTSVFFLPTGFAIKLLLDPLFPPADGSRDSKCESTR